MFLCQGTTLAVKRLLLQHFGFTGIAASLISIKDLKVDHVTDKMQGEEITVEIIDMTLANIVR